MSEPEWRQRLYADYVGAPTTATAEASFQSRAPYLKRAVRRHFSPARDAAIVDLGCGAGDLVRAARTAGYTDITGIDRAPSQVRLAEALDIDGICEGDLLDAIADFADESYDVIVTFDVLEHLDTEEAFRLADHVRRVLKPGGRWILHVPNGESPFFGRVRYGDLTHERAFVRESLEQLARASAFSAIDCYEDTPTVHGLTSALRWLAWRFVRLTYRFCIAAETGETGARIVLSQNLLAVVEK